LGFEPGFTAVDEPMDGLLVLDSMTADHALPFGINIFYLGTSI
jgi:hypothetical protein